MVPLTILYLQAFTLGHNQGATEFLSILLLVTTIPLMIYELSQFSKHTKKYFEKIGNFIDFLAILMYLCNGISMLAWNSRDTATISIYSITILLGFLKLYSNLSVVDMFRSLSFALPKIIIDSTAF